MSVEYETLDSETTLIEFESHPDDSSYVVMRTVLPIVWLTAIRNGVSSLSFCREELLPAIEKFQDGQEK